MTVEIARIPPRLRATVGGPRRSCARLGFLYVFVGSQGTRYCSAECQELERREQEAERKRRRRREAAAPIRTAPRTRKAALSGSSRRDADVELATSPGPDIMAHPRSFWRPARSTREPVVGCGRADILVHTASTSTALCRERRNGATFPRPSSAPDADMALLRLPSLGRIHHVRGADTPPVVGLAGLPRDRSGSALHAEEVAESGGCRPLGQANARKVAKYSPKIWAGVGSFVSVSPARPETRDPRRSARHLARLIHEYEAAA
jgi:hypothetical protein